MIGGARMGKITSDLDAASVQDTRLYSAQLDLLYNNARPALFAALASAAVLMAALWDQVHQSTLLAWFGIYALVQLPRFMLLRSFFRTAPENRWQKSWGIRYSALTWLAGFMWGLGGVVLFPEQSVAHQSLLAIFIAGIAAAATVTFSPVSACFLPTIFLELLPPAARFFAEDTETGIIIGSVIVMYAIVLVITGKNIYATIWESLKLRFEKEDLVVQLSRHKIRIEKLNEALKQEIAERERLFQQLEQARNNLEARVQERTADLHAMNEQLRKEMEERIQAERLSLESQMRFQAVFESARDLMFVKNAALEFTHVNPAMLDTFGIREKQVLGARDERVFSGDEIRHSRSLDQRALAGDLVEDEHTLSIAGVSVTLNWVRFPLRTPDGKIWGICGIGRDVTERREYVDTTAHANEMCRSPAMRETIVKLRMAAEADCIVLLLGESGSGKDYWARRLHDYSSRSTRPFLGINCAALAADLVESELFGHEKGAFTGALRRKRGILEMAEGGTLLLNEIGELPLQLQAKILTFLDTNTFMRVGGERVISVDVRILAATNRDLRKQVATGFFREDLFYRLNIFPIDVPPLRNRVEDIPNLVEELLESLTSRVGIASKPVLEPKALRLILEYPWPGNVRELRNVLEHALILSGGTRIAANHLRSLRRGDPSHPISANGLSFVIRLDEELGMPRVLREAKHWMIDRTLKRFEGNLEQASRALGLSRDSLKHHMKALGIRRELSKSDKK